jgi:hypothetical protein
MSLRLPDCEIGTTATGIGTNTFHHNTISGYGVGIWVSPDGEIALGTPLPTGLAKLRV